MDPRLTRYGRTMLHALRPLLHLCLWASLAWAGGVPPGFAPGRMVALERALDERPQDPLLNAEYATGLAKTGRCSAAQPHLDLGGVDAWPSQADCLRIQGQPRQAAALRPLLIVAAPRPLLHWMALAEDLRLSGDLVAAEAAADHALALQPSGKRVMAFYVELALDRGDVAQAQARLAVADFHEGRDPSELILARARTLASLGELGQAEFLVLEAGSRGRQPVRAACLRSRILMEQDNPALAWAILSQPRFLEREELCLVRARALSLRALGDEGGAESWESLGRRLAMGRSLDTEALH